MRGMIPARIRSNWLLIGCVALMLLVGVAAVQQYRWINRVSEADRRQRREFVEATLRNFGDDFRERLHEPLPYFRPSPVVPPDTAFEPYLSRLALQWRATAEHPQLLGSVSFATASTSGVIFKRLRIADKQFTEESWPEALMLYRTILENRLRMPGGEPPLFPNGFALALSEQRPVLVFPLVVSNEPPPPPRPEDSNMSSETSQPATSGAPDRAAPSARMPPLGPEPGSLLQQLRPAPPGGVIHVPELKGWCFLELDLDYLENQLLPELVARHFGQETLNDYRVAVVTGRPTKIIYRSDAQLNADALLSSDAEIVIFNPHLQPGRPAPPPPPPPPVDENAGQPRPERPPPPPAGPPPPFVGDGGVAPGNRTARTENAEEWRLVLKNRSGSLDALVAQQRRRNLALSFGILLLLAGSTLMLMLATRRARSLARQQMEFVAGVSHELRTPLTVIQSTSYNLSKGMIQEPGRVEKYGLVIQKEARRLINQIERMLSFAGIQSGQKLYELRPVEVKKIIDRAFDEHSTAFEEGGWHVDKQIDEDLPQVLADAQSLESAIENLLENGLKYASEGKRLSISAKSVEHRRHREVQITVADKGPGIAPADLPHIFEPFYRGQGVLASSINGSGLGLCLVERHLRAQGGRVTVKSSPVEGTAFTLHLPAHEVAGDIEGAK